MQTRRIFSSLRNFLRRRVFPGVAIAAFIAPLAACNAPRIESPIESAGPCKTAYTNAVSSNSHSVAGYPFIDRYLSAGNAVKSWREAATLCPSQFSVYTMKSAQMQWQQQSLSPLVEAEPTHPNAAVANLDDIVALRVSNDTLASLALAEDRAGFEIQVLAAKDVSHATLQLSDDHKAIASRLISLETKEAGDTGAPNDPREKVYDVANLLAHPDTITDPSTGLQASTVAVVEMDCARESLAALSQALPVSNNKTDDSSSGSGIASKNRRSKSSGKSLAVLADLISSRIYLALSLGYPAFDAALYE
ncbi:hypothetical protein OZX67_02555 [Bifidobacterium sp. ESL0728]|uniref:hypothetical protein n=1 Tax=Bifidobacterium sp. ESL0728 TaxID=2983220 RepID=UPI0023F7DF56|nr:hypothetical protein [Bifidobacterium sp. ESL0728]WEV59453.1 hypothetical protein OZX67_02555 [Bifidobacterium sp. ESL0728]